MLKVAASRSGTRVVGVETISLFDLAEMGDHNRRKKQKAEREHDEHDYDEEEAYAIHDANHGVENDNDDGELARLKLKSDAKANKRFSILLLKSAAEHPSYEEHDTANLAVLISVQLKLTPKKTLQLLKDADIITPVVLSTLSDCEITFTPGQIIGAFYDQAQHVDRFIGIIEDALEQNLLNLKDAETLTAVSYSSLLLCLFDAAVFYLSFATAYYTHFV